MRACSSAASTSGPSKGARASTGAAPDGGLVGRGGEDGREAGGVADGAERGDRGLADEGVVVVLGELGEEPGGVGLGGLALAAGPGGHLGDGVVGVVEERQQGDAARPALGVVGQRGHLLGGAAAHHGSGVGDGQREVVGGEVVGAGEGPERGGAHGRLGVGQQGPGGGRVVLVPGQRRGSAPCQRVVRTYGHATKGTGRGRL